MVVGGWGDRGFQSGTVVWSRYVDVKVCAREAYSKVKSDFGISSFYVGEEAGFLVGSEFVGESGGGDEGGEERKCPQ